MSLPLHALTQVGPEAGGIAGNPALRVEPVAIGDMHDAGEGSSKQGGHQAYDC